MKSFRTVAYKKHLAQLPLAVEEQAKKTYYRWKENPHHPSLDFKKLAADIWSIRIGYSYRALCTMPNDNEAVWFWIGTHEDYNGLLKQLKALSKGLQQKK